MPTQSIDTDPAAERAQLELLRQASRAARFERVRSLTRSSVQLALPALERRDPDWSREALLVEFVGLNHGPALAEAVRQDLVARGRLP